MDGSSVGAVNHRTQEKKGDGCHRSGYHQERERGTVSLQVIQRTGMKSNYILQALRGVGGKLTSEAAGPIRTAPP